MQIKAVILAAGRGSRLCPLTPFLPKEMLPLGGLPAFHHVLQEVADVGVTEVMAVIAKGKELVREYCSKPIAPKGALATRLSKERERLLSKMHISFVYQRSLNGTADAILLAKEFAGKYPLLVVYPDDLITLTSEDRGVEELRLMASQTMSVGHSCILCREIPRDAACNYGVPRLKEQRPDGFYPVEGIVEKPTDWREEKACAMIGRMILTPSLLSRIPTLPRNDRDGIIPALNEAAMEGELAALIHCGSHWDIGSHLGYLEAAASCQKREE